LLGVGFIGKVHATAYSQMNNAELVAIADTDDTNRHSMAEKLPAVDTYTDAEEVLKRDDIDMIDICLPTYEHKRYAIKAIEAGKHVLCEKPMALSVEETEQMIESAEKSDKKFMIAHVIRFWAEYVKAKEILDSGELGKALEISALRLGTTPASSVGNWMLDPMKSGGAILDLSIHDIDFVTWLLGEPKRVYAQGIRSKYGAWDHMITMITYADETKAIVEGGWLMPPTYPFTMGLRIKCERGCIEFDFKAGVNIEKREEAGAVLTVYKEDEPPEYPEVTPKDGYLNEIEYFVDCINEDKDPDLVTPKEASLAVKLALAARESAETGKVIEID